MRYLCIVRALSEAEIVGLYGCEADLAGDLVTWSPARWSLEEGAASANTDYRSCRGLDRRDDCRGDQRRKRESEVDRPGARLQV